MPFNSAIVVPSLPHNPATLISAIAWSAMPRSNAPSSFVRLDGRSPNWSQYLQFIVSRQYAAGASLTIRSARSRNTNNGVSRRGRRRIPVWLPRPVPSPRIGRTGLNRLKPRRAGRRTGTHFEAEDKGSHRLEPIGSRQEHRLRIVQTHHRVRDLQSAEPMATIPERARVGRVGEYRDRDSQDRTRSNDLGLKSAELRDFIG